MRYRIKFTKLGDLKYIAHLDVLRIWQKAIKKSRVAIVYSDGFNKHQKISLAIPLGLGLTSEAEYVDIYLEKPIEVAVLKDKLNANLPEGMKVTNLVEINKQEKNAMASVAAALYLCVMSDVDIDVRRKLLNKEVIQNYLHRDTILVMKKTKTAIKEHNIRPDIFQMEITEDGLLLQLACGSERNLKPELVMQSLFDFAEIEPFSIQFHRKEIYKNVNGSLQPLHISI